MEINIWKERVIILFVFLWDIPISSELVVIVDWTDCVKWKKRFISISWMVMVGIRHGVLFNVI